jgi:2-oxoacid:acceptor oxidoreductase delta subunit (pyruvate/2-ketoisovalerate family)
MEGEERPLLGRRVVVYGGGNTAMDAARTAKRLGATEAIVVYRRTRDRMPAHDIEVEEALAEGLLMRWLSTVTRVDEGRMWSSGWSWTRPASRSRPAGPRSWRRTAWSWRSGTAGRRRGTSTPGCAAAAVLDGVRRSSTFDEVGGGLDESTAKFEARRCLSCGNCFECDNCYGVCPDNAVIKLGAGNRYEIDLDYCKGCGICVQECPCGAIDLEPETI